MFTNAICKALMNGSAMSFTHAMTRARLYNLFATGAFIAVVIAVTIFGIYFGIKLVNRK